MPSQRHRIRVPKAMKAVESFICFPEWGKHPVYRARDPAWSERASEWNNFHVIESFLGVGFAKGNRAKGFDDGYLYYKIPSLAVLTKS